MAEQLDEERVREIIEINDVLDEMVVRIISLVETTLSNLPGKASKMAFLRKLSTALSDLASKTREEED